MNYAELSVKAINSDSPSGSFEAVLSKPTVDRDKEIIEAGAFNPLPAKIPIHVDHVMSAMTLVGSGTPFYDGDTLKIRGTFASGARAQMVRSLITDGHLDSMSVGFTAAKKSAGGKGPRRISKAELLEASFVTVPSNREALVTSVRSHDPDQDYVERLALQIYSRAIQSECASAIKTADRLIAAETARNDRRIAAVMARHGLPAPNMKSVLAWAKAESARKTAQQVNGGYSDVQSTYVQGLGWINVRSVVGDPPESDDQPNALPRDQRVTGIDPNDVYGTPPPRQRDHFGGVPDHVEVRYGSHEDLPEGA